ncbi:MAG: hypothetical protein WDO73_03115 [Ignavibacteriota bacterium]
MRRFWPLDYEFEKDGTVDWWLQNPLHRPASALSSSTYKVERRGKSGTSWTLFACSPNRKNK